MTNKKLTISADQLLHENKELRQKLARAKEELRKAKKKNKELNHKLHSDIIETDNAKIYDAQNFLLQCGLPGTGEDFFESLARYLAGILEMDYVCIDKIESKSSIAETIAIFNEGNIDPNITYTLNETPCGDVVGNTICCFPQNVCALFPNDKALLELRAESYIGTTLWSHEGKPIGLIAVIGRKPLENRHFAEVILKLAAIRAAGELERKVADKAKSESEERFRTIAETAPMLICVTRIKDSIVLFTNEVNNKAFGLKGEQIIGTKGPDYYCDPEDRERMIEQFKRNGKLNNYKVKVKKNDGTPFWIMTSVRPITFYGEPAMIGASIDITEYQKVEDALLESEKKFRNLIKYAPAVIYEMDLLGTKFISVNDTMCDILKYSRKELYSIRPMDLLDETSQLHFKQRIKNKLEGSPIEEDIEYRVRRKDGLWVDALITVGNITFTNDKAHSITVIAYDITERKKMEEAIRESEKKFRELVKYAPTAIYELDFIERKFLTVNDSMCIMSGYSREELLSSDPLELLDAESRGLFLNRINKCLRGEKPDENVEYNVRAKDGRIINAVLNMKFNFNENGIPVGAMVVGHDITERKLAEKELLSSKEAFKESEKRFRTLAENIPDMIVRFDKDLRFLYGNPAVAKRTGMDVDPFLGKTSSEYGGRAVSTGNWENIAREVLSLGEARRVEHTNSWLGITKVFDTLLVPEKDDNGVVNSVISIARDITEMKRSEIILRDSEQRLKYHLENSPLAVVEWDKDFNLLQWSSEAEKIFGQKKEEVLGVRFDLLNIIYPDDFPKVEKTIQRLSSGKELKIISQNRNITKNGEIKECIWYNSVLLNENGEMSSVMSLVQDITLLRKTEKELIQSRESYKELVTNARSIIIKMDTSGRCTFVNEFALNFFGYTLDEMFGIPVMDTIMPRQESTGRDLMKMADNIIVDPDSFSVNINENIKKNGELVWIEWHNKALFDDKGNRTGHIGIGIDITQKKRAEEALLESEGKLRTVLDATQESIYLFDRDGIICMSNSTGIKRLKKKSENEIIGHHFSEFMSASTALNRMEKHSQVVNSGAPVEFTDERDGRLYNHNFFPIFKDNKVSFVVTYSTDITERKRSEDNLKASEDRFRTIAESLPVLISIFRIKDSTFSFVNESFEKAFGVNPGELTNCRLPNYFFSPEVRKDLGDSLRENGNTYNKELRVRRADGIQFWIMTNIQKIRFMDEPAYLTASIDITETKKAQEELIRLNRTLDAHSKSSQAMMNSSDEFSYLNNVCKIIIDDCGHSMVWVGYAQNDRRKSVKPVAFYGFDQGYIDMMDISWDESDRGRGPTGTAIRTGKPSMCKNMQTDPAFAPWRKAAIERGYSASLVLPLISEGKSFGAVSIYSIEPDPFSVSEINLLVELADDLAHGISFIRLTQSEREAARVISESEARLKELVATKDKFFNIVAHDLKNPFTSLLGSSELLYDNISNLSPENVRNLALILNDSAKSGYAILQNLLDWSRSETGLLKYNPENTNLKIIIDENIENLQLQVANKEIILKSEVTEDLYVFSDKNMINTILRNLLSNSVKYTFKNGTILVKVKKGPEEITITVKDSGIGISQERVYSLFRIENTMSLPGTEKEMGTGLGLKLCKEFTERIGGKIWVESRSGLGSEFKFTIPLNYPKTQVINNITS